MRFERWRDVVGYEGLYQISDLGRVLRVPQRDADGKIVRKEKILRSSPRDKSGRMGVRLRKDKVGKGHYVDKLVLAAWVGPMKTGYKVVHGEEGITDNSVENLVYKPRKSKKWRPGVCVLRSDDAIFVSFAHAAECSGISEGRIRRACKERHTYAGGWQWQRME